MASSGSVALNLNGGAGTYAVYISVSENLNAADNTSTVNWSIHIEKTSTSGYAYVNNSPKELTYNLNIGGEPNTGYTGYDFSSYAGVSGGATAQGYYTGTTTTAFSHNQNGTGSVGVTLSVSSKNNGYIGGSSSTISFTFDLTDINRGPTTPSFTLGARSSNGTSLGNSAWSGGVNNSGPQVTFQLQRSLNNISWSNVPGQVNSSAYSGNFTDSGLGNTTDYYYRVYAFNADYALVSTASLSYAPPMFTSITLPQAITGKSYTGSITGNNVSTYTISSGSLPTGLSLSGASIVGTPTVPGTYTFVIRATRTGISYVDSATQTIQVLSGGPWVRLSSPFISQGIAYVALTNNVATITTLVNHGITELNQPITITNLTGAHALFNGNWVVTSFDAGTVSFALTGSDIAQTTPIGTSPSLLASWKRSSLKVYVGGQWVSAYSRVWNGTAWVNTK